MTASNLIWNQRMTLSGFRLNFYMFSTLCSLIRMTHKWICLRLVTTVVKAIIWYRSNNNFFTGAFKRGLLTMLDSKRKDHYTDSDIMWRSIWTGQSVGANCCTNSYKSHTPSILHLSRLVQYGRVFFCGLNSKWKWCMLAEEECQELELSARRTADLAGLEASAGVSCFSEVIPILQFIISRLDEVQR